MRHIDVSLTDTTSLDHSGPGSKDNKIEFYNSPSSKTGATPLDAVQVLIWDIVVLEKDKMINKLDLA